MHHSERLMRLLTLEEKRRDSWQLPLPPIRINPCLLVSKKFIKGPYLSPVGNFSSARPNTTTPLLPILHVQGFEDSKAGTQGQRPAAADCASLESS